MHSYKQAFMALMFEGGAYGEISDAVEEAATLNRDGLESSARSRCFSCGAEIDPRRISRWTDGGETAICPECSVDLVVPEGEGVPLDACFAAAFSEARSTANLRAALAAGAECLELCVLHHPLTGCRITPQTSFEDYPVERAVVVFRGRAGHGPVRVGGAEPGTSLEVSFEHGDCGVDIVLRTPGGGGARDPFEDGRVYRLQLGLCDAMESWTVVASIAPVNLKAKMAGYKVEEKTRGFGAGTVFASKADLRQRKAHFRRLGEEGRA
ncbi:MAG: hypothetical protein ACI36Y_08750 [Coriobacteriales bacterium]